jgi:hypothetical protein
MFEEEQPIIVIVKTSKFGVFELVLKSVLLVNNSDGRSE